MNEKNAYVFVNFVKVLVALLYFAALFVLVGNVLIHSSFYIDFDDL